MKSNRLNKGVCLTVILWAVYCLINSCNKTVQNLLPSQYPNDSAAYSDKRKVLYITIDGLSGDMLQTLQPKNLIALTHNALFCYNGLSDNGSTTLSLATAWANQMTGVSVAKHQVTNDDFTGDSLSKFPSFIDLLKSARPQTRTTAFSSSDEFLQHFGKSADVKASFSGNDSLAAAAAEKSLKQDSSDLVVVQLHAPDSVGNVYGYNNSLYTDAIMRTDNYVGGIVSALQSRPDYLNENWLVIITSSIGTPQIKLASNPFTDSSRNIFAIFYNARFSSSFLAKPDVTQLPYTGASPYYTYTSGNFVNATLGNSYAYNFGSNGGHTIQFLMKSKATGSTGGYRPSMISKRTSDFSGNGWDIYMTGTGWGFTSSVAPDAITPSGNNGINIEDGLWHALTAVVTMNNGINTVKIYTDGVFNISTQGTNATSIIDNNMPLKIGRYGTSSYGTSKLLVTNLQIYDTAFSDEDVANYALVTSIDNTNPYYNNLIGYWPSDEQGSDTLTERTHHLVDSTGLDFTLSGPWAWQQFSDLTGYLRVPITPTLYKLVPEGNDVAFQIFQWIGIPVQTNWELDGTGWAPSYSSVLP